jgi:hypothetical protein
MARKIRIIIEEKNSSCLPKYNYGTGFGWCVKRDKKRAKYSTSKAASGRRR